MGQVITEKGGSDLTEIVTMRLFLAIITLAFTLYMVPGLWGAPLKVIAAFLPPQQTQDFDLYSTSLNLITPPSPLGEGRGKARKYEDIFLAPFDLNAFFDYEEGMAYARQKKKPVMIDFTGHACVNCRKMEATIWPEPEVLKSIREDYVLIQLYVDDKTELPAHEQKVSSYSGKLIKTIGNKWSEFQANTFNTNSQPYYVLLDHSEKQLIPPKGADYDAESFKAFLEEGLSAFKKHERHSSD